MNRITNEINKLNKTTEIKEAEIRDRRGEQKKKKKEERKKPVRIGYMNAVGVHWNSIIPLMTSF